MSIFHLRIVSGILSTAFALAATTCFAQDGTIVNNAPENRDLSQSASATSPKPQLAPISISFQLRDWKQMHFNDVRQAEKHLKTVEQLGCVAKKSQHGDHIDVQYHCQEWKTISLDNAESAQQWQSWLSSAGFDVFQRRVDPEFLNGAKAVQFRLVEFKAIHGDRSDEQMQFLATLKKIGCDVQESQHNGHIDIKFRAPTWCTLRFADMTAANQWKNWLQAQGFESQVVENN